MNSGGKQTLISLLREHQPYNQKEADHLKHILTFLEEYQNCFSRSNSYGHITGSAWILNSRRDKCLLVHHRKLGRWLQPGGHADGETDIRKVSLMEAREETGLFRLEISQKPFDVDVHVIPERGNERAHYHFDLRYEIQADDSEKVIVSEESNDVRWISKKEIYQLISDDSVLRMVEKSNMILPAGQ